MIVIVMAAVGESGDSGDSDEGERLWSSGRPVIHQSASV